MNIYYIFLNKLDIYLNSYLFKLSIFNIHILVNLYIFFYIFLNIKEQYNDYINIINSE